jgi:hypothetical protein
VRNAFKAGAAPFSWSAPLEVNLEVALPGRVVDGRAKPLLCSTLCAIAASTREGCSARDVKASLHASFERQ